MEGTLLIVSGREHEWEELDLYLRVFSPRYDFLYFFEEGADQQRQYHPTPEDAEKLEEMLSNGNDIAGIVLPHHGGAGLELGAAIPDAIRPMTYVVWSTNDFPERPEYEEMGFDRFDTIGQLCNRLGKKT